MLYCIRRYFELPCIYMQVLFYALISFIRYFNVLRNIWYIILKELVTNYCINSIDRIM